MISVKNLKKTYFLGGEEVYALDDVSLSIKEHEFVAIIGQSGSGKSTFMNMLGCLDRPDSGEITLDGTDILKCKEKELSVIRNKTVEQERSETPVGTAAAGVTFVAAPAVAIGFLLAGCVVIDTGGGCGAAVVGRTGRGDYR